MTEKNATQQGSSFPVSAMLIIALVAGLIVGASFEIIKVWPLPQSVEPAYDFMGGFLWGLTVGGVSGLVLAFLTDDSHFAEAKE